MGACVLGVGVGVGDVERSGGVGVVDKVGDVGCCGDDGVLCLDSLATAWIVVEEGQGRVEEGGVSSDGGVCLLCVLQRALGKLSQEITVPVLLFHIIRVLVMQYLIS